MADPFLDGKPVKLPKNGSDVIGCFFFWFFFSFFSFFSFFYYYFFPSPFHNSSCNSILHCL